MFPHMMRWMCEDWRAPVEPVFFEHGVAYARNAAAHFGFQFFKLVWSNAAGNPEHGMTGCAHSV
jgi:hypothetical protein